MTAVVAETDLTRSEDDEPAGDNKAAKKGSSKVLGKLGKVGKLVKTGVKLLPKAGGADAVDMTGTLVAEHFKPIKSVIAEVDGQPPALDAAVVALTALSNVLQTVTASPDPQDAIKKQGGLAELTGAVARQALVLPDPIDDWLGGIASDTSGLTEKAVTSELNAIWRADILPFCQAALNNRYPFTAESAVDVNVKDFARLFGPGGLIDAFTNDHLINYVDTTAQPWKWRADFGLSSDALKAFEQARRIRDDLFPGRQGPTMAFTLQPKDLSPDGHARHAQSRRPEPRLFQQRHPPAADDLARQGRHRRHHPGLPADRRFARSAGQRDRQLGLAAAAAQRPLHRHDLSDVYALRLGTQDFFADFELKASSVENPYNLQMFKRFSCPTQI